MKRVVISSFITLIILGLIAAGYFYYQRSSITVTDPVKAIPANAVFYMEAKGAKEILKKLSTGDLFSSLTIPDSAAGANLSLVDSALSSDNDIKEIWEEKTIFLSAHLTKANNFDYLWLANVPSSWTDDKAEHFISKAFHAGSVFSRRVYENIPVHELALSGGKNFSFTVTKGIFIGSFTSFLIDDAIRQIKNGTPVTKSKAFSKAADYSGSGDNLSVYINYISLREFLSAYSYGGNGDVFNAISSFARWTKLNAEIQNNGLLFRGRTASTDTTDFISSLAAQEPQRLDMAEILPARTALFVYTGFSDQANFFRHLHSHSAYFDPADKRMKMISSIEKKFNVQADQSLTSWIGNEMALVITEPGSSSFENNSYCVIGSPDVEKATASLAELQRIINKNNDPAKPDEYRKHPLGFINLAGLVPLFYSNLFSNISRFYYTTAGHYIVIANQSSSLKSFVDDFEDNKTLSEDASFKNAMRNAERTSSYFVYLNLERSKNIFRHYASDELGELLNRNQTFLNRFSVFTYQISNHRENFETTVQLLQSKEKISNASLLWSAQLDTTADMIPFTFKNAETKNNSVVIQDDKFNLYMIDEAGNITWKKTLPEKILGSIHLVDAYRNGQQQILFNTAGQLYLFDLTGNDYGNYPIHLPAQATNGCVVLDIDQSKNYKIFLACSNKGIYAYDISGKPMSGWMFSQPVPEVMDPLQYFRVKEKDYLLVYNHKGNVYLLDKKGNTRNAFKQMYVGAYSAFSMMPGDSTTDDHLVATDTTGKVIDIFLNGTVKLKSFGLKSPEHAFKTADIDGDGKNDLIFLDHHQLNVLGEDSSVIYYHIFMENIFPEVNCFTLNSSLQQTGFGSKEENKFYLLNRDGKISNGFPVKGYRGIAVDEWGTEGKRTLVTTGSDGNVYLYNLE
ncbi:MAG: DUF3352 domain-containing protein [Bacteroidetes bacterium]|nr:DUF3352 domain-containing protein [Bacteroidota bacterium]